jgi:hypothetical protein
MESANVGLEDRWAVVVEFNASTSDPELNCVTAGTRAFRDRKTSQYLS